MFIANPDSPQSLAAALRAATLAYELRAAAPEPLPDPEPDFLAGATAEQLHRLSALFAEITVDSEDRARRTGERANPWPDRPGPKSAWAPCRVGDAFGLSAAAVAAVEAYEARPEIAGTSYRGPTAAPPASLLEAAQAVVRAYELRCELAARLQGGGFGFQAADGRYHGPGLLWREVDAGVPRAIHNLRRTLEAPEIARLRPPWPIVSHHPRHTRNPAGHRFRLTSARSYASSDSSFRLAGQTRLVE